MKPTIRSLIGRVFPLPDLRAVEAPANIHLISICSDLQLRVLEISECPKSRAAFDQDLDNIGVLH